MEVSTMARKTRSPEENERRAKIRELLQVANVSSMDDIQTLFKDTISVRCSCRPNSHWFRSS